MIQSELVIAVIALYLLSLFGLAYFVEKKFKQGVNLADNAFVYALSVAIYCTAWTFYGNVGLAVTSSFLFLGVYIGPVMFFLFWKTVLKRMIKIRHAYGVTSIADFISLRYGKSQAVAAIVSAIALVGIVPYLSLQLKAILNSYAVITTGNVAVSGAMNPIDFFLVLAIIVFVIIFGLRTIDQAERHPGMVLVVAIQSIIKLVAFLAVGFFVTYVLYDGFGDLFSRIESESNFALAQARNIPSYSLFMAYTVLSFSAIIFLPRQFQMLVVENNQEKHLRTAVWIAPLYFIAIIAFVFPVAIAGILQGLDAAAGDSFILLLPLTHGAPWLSMAVFFGGLSAAFSMLMISAMTITIMVSNYLILPLLERVTSLSFLIKFLLMLRWIVVVAIMTIAYMFEVKLGSSYVLVKIGMISFAAVLQFAPAIIGGLFWEKGNKIGAILGLLSGFAVWLYTCLFPAIVRSGWMSESILQNGPFGIGFLRPENMLGISVLDPLAITVLLSLIVNTAFFVIGSLLGNTSEQEENNTVDFFTFLGKYARLKKGDKKQQAGSVVADKIKIIEDIFSEYLSEGDIEKNVQSCLELAGVARKKKITLNELIMLNDLVEKTLARFIGAPAASEALRQKSLLDGKEMDDLSELYSQMALEMKLTPGEFSEKINYLTEKGELLNNQQAELEKLVKIRTLELEEKMSELEQWQKATMNRELKMLELKEELNELRELNKQK